MLQDCSAISMTARLASPVEIYQIKVTLRDSQPPIWRRIQVSSDTTLAKLHRVLQCVMGWKDAHFHQFVIQGQQKNSPATKSHQLSGLPGRGSRLSPRRRWRNTWL